MSDYGWVLLILILLSCWAVSAKVGRLGSYMEDVLGALREKEDVLLKRLERVADQVADELRPLEDLEGTVKQTIEQAFEGRPEEDTQSVNDKLERIADTVDDIQTHVKLANDNDLQGVIDMRLTRMNEQLYSLRRNIDDLEDACRRLEEALGAIAARAKGESNEAKT